MRDPLAWVPIRYKLPLGFLLVCVVAFGIGGVVITQTAGASLEGEIRQRLDEQAKATALVVGRRLELYGRRVEDFASDGYIRVQTEALGAHPADPKEVQEALRRHLLENKLPLVDAFVDAAVLGPDGELLLGAIDPPSIPGDSIDATSFGPLLPPATSHSYPSFVIASPLTSLSGGRPIGALALLIRADAWVDGVLGAETAGARTAHRAFLIDPAGRRLDMVETGAIRESDALRYETPIAPNGWTCVLEIDLRSAMRPIAELRDRYLLIGALLLLVVATVLFFPMRFLLRPLARIAEAARSLAGGDFSTRVESESRDEIGDLSRAFNIMADAVEERTTQLEQAARRLERREKDIRFERDRLNAVIRSMEDGLFILDPEGKVLLANAAAQPLIHELQSREAGAKRVDCEQERDDRDCLQCLADGGGVDRSCVVHVEGRFYEVQVTMLPAPRQGPPGRICVSRDITGRIAESDRQSHQERMAVLGEVAAVMAHELNNPLAAIAMFSQMLEGELEEGSELRENAEVIRRNTETCKHSIRGLLDLAAQATPEPTAFDVHDMLEDVRTVLRPIYQRAGVAFRMELDATDTEAFGDELQLRQVIVNLVMNAIQASEGDEGSVALATSDGEDAIRIEVRDRGPGVPAELRARIFEPFFTTKPPGTGTGLGLPTSRRVVEAHGGSLELDTEVGSGSTFRLELPRRGSVSTWQTSVRLSEGVAHAPPSVEDREDDA